MRIVISARPYNEYVGGHVALHKLCDSLVRQGMPAVLRPDSSSPWEVNPNYLSPVTDRVERNDVVVYHDTVRGNPWKAAKVIRWMLYKPRFDTDGVLLYYTSMYGPGPYLYVIEPHLDLFVNRGEPRSGVCWTWRKAEKQGWKRNQRPTSGAEIMRGTSNRDLVEIFNRHERFVCYDGASWLAIQAALCGCDVIVPRPVGGPFPYPGIAHSESEIVRARDEQYLLREKLECEYKEQDKKAAEVMRWAIAQFQ